MKYVHLDLKVCEGCGTLWLRTTGSDCNYCSGCTSRFAGFPSPAAKRGGGRPRTRTISRAASRTIAFRRGCASAAARATTQAGAR